MYKVYIKAIIYGLVVGTFFGAWVKLGNFWGILIGIAIAITTVMSEKLREKNIKNKENDEKKDMSS